MELWQQLFRTHTERPEPEVLYGYKVLDRFQVHVYDGREMVEMWDNPPHFHLWEKHGQVTHEKHTITVPVKDGLARIYRSPTHYAWWENDTLQAKTPTKRNSYGIYCTMFPDHEELEAYARSNPLTGYQTFPQPGRVLVVLELRGKVIQHENKVMRAEWARVIEEIPMPKSFTHKPWYDTCF